MLQYMSNHQEFTMKPVQAVRTSKTVSVTVSSPLYAQVVLFARLRRITLSSMFNQAVLEYLDTHTYLRTPNIREMLKATDNQVPKRDRTISAAMKHETARTALENLAKEQHLTVSALMRRALYEYTKPEDATPIDPLVTIDAWGDQPNNAGKT